MSVISSFLLREIPGHDTRLFEVGWAFKRTLLTAFRAYISGFRGISQKTSPPAALTARPPGGLPGGPPGRPVGVMRATRLASPVVVPATAPGPLMYDLVHTAVQTGSNQDIFGEIYPSITTVYLRHHQAGSMR